MNSGFKLGSLMIVAVFSLVCGCLNNSDRATGEDLSSCDKISNIRDRDSCLFNLRDTINDSQLCGKILTTELRDTCYQDIAIRKTDETICGEIRSKEIQYLCKAVVQKKLSECDKISNHTSRNWNLCNALVAIHTGNYTICDHVSNYFMDDICYSGTGVNTDNISLCEKISDQGEKYRCTAIVTRDKKLCEKIQIASLTKRCIETIEKKNQNE